MFPPTLGADYSTHSEMRRVVHLRVMIFQRAIRGHAATRKKSYPFCLHQVTSATRMLKNNPLPSHTTTKSIHGALETMRKERLSKLKKEDEKKKIISEINKICRRV